MSDPMRESEQPVEMLVVFAARASANTKKEVGPSCSRTQIQSTSPYLLPNRETLTWQEFGFLLELGVKQEDEVSGGLSRSGDVGFGPSHVIGDTQRERRGGEGFC